MPNGFLRNLSRRNWYGSAGHCVDIGVLTEQHEARRVPEHYAKHYVPEHHAEHI